MRELRFLLTRERWERVERPPVEIVGLQPCLPLFGVGDHGGQGEPTDPS